MQQETRRRAFRAGLSVKDREPVYTWRAIKSRGKQVAYHVGPLHGESKSHCELHDARSGRLIAAWDGDLESGGDRPAWTKGLNH